MFASTDTRAGLIASAVAILFVPGDRPDRFAKAVASGAEAVIIDLEDAVAAESKGFALAALIEALSRPDPIRPLVRINPPGSVTYDTELEALATILDADDCALAGLVLPKAESAKSIDTLGAALGAALPIVPLIESALGLLNVGEIARAAGVVRLGFGAIDFALDVDAADGDERMLGYAASGIVVASSAARIAAPLDSPSVEIVDAAAVESAAKSGRELGFGGKLCIHPNQLAPVRAGYRPTTAQVDWARAVLGAGRGAAQVAGQMVDRPVLDRAQRVLRAAGESA